MAGARPDGSLVKAKLASASPADVLLQPVFNPVGGYASYIVPAAFILILQQTLMIGAAMLSLASVLSKTISPGAVIPIGIVTALIGVPFFVGLVLRYRPRPEHDGLPCDEGVFLACSFWLVEALCGIAAPWQMVGAIALGTPAVVPPAPGRRAPAQLIRWIEEESP